MGRCGVGLCAGHCHVGSPLTLLDDDTNQSSKYDDQPKPPSTEAKESPDTPTQKFVVLPHHPLYGCLVTILNRRIATTYVDCTIEDPAHPDFRYHIREWWLSSTQPPPLPISPTPNEAICLPLSAVDKMVQRLLTTPYFRGSRTMNKPITSSRLPGLSPEHLQSIWCQLPLKS